MRVVILTEGGKGIGFGHIARCGALYQALKEKKVSVELIVNGDDSILSLLKGKRYRAFDWLKKKHALEQALSGADAVVIDSYLARPDFYRKLSRIADLAVYIDDNKRISYPDGIVANGNIHADTLGYPKKRGVRYLLGTKYAPLRKEFWDSPSKNIRERLRSVIVTFGGDDSRNLTRKVLRLLVSGYPELIKNVIVGSGFRNVNLLDKLKDSRTNLVHNPDTGRLKRLMASSDIAISAGGQTLNELARVGTPAIVVTAADNQSKNIDLWQRSGFIDHAGWWEDDRTAKKIVKYIERLKDADVRARKSNVGMVLVDGNGTKRIVQEILRAI